MIQTTLNLIKKQYFNMSIYIFLVHIISTLSGLTYESNKKWQAKFQRSEPL